MESTTLLEADGLGKRYGRRAALADCDLSVPRGRIVGLVGPNGAGKSTLLQLVCGLLRPTSGSLRVLGARPATSAAHLARVGFVAQDTPVYADLTVADHLHLGARLNPGWDASLAERRIAEIGVEPRRKAGRLSGGQRAQLALALAAGKRPELLLLDEPAAALDPLARTEFLQHLRNSVTELAASAVLSSHLLSDVERVCDYLIVLGGGRLQIAGDVRTLLASHHVLDARADAVPAGAVAVAGHVVRSAAPTPPGRPASLEELVLAYLTRAAEVAR